MIEIDVGVDNADDQKKLYWVVYLKSGKLCRECGLIESQIEKLGMAWSFLNQCVDEASAWQTVLSAKRVGCLSKETKELEDRIIMEVRQVERLRVGLFNEAANHNQTVNFEVWKSNYEGWKSNYEKRPPEHRAKNTGFAYSLSET